MYYRVKAFIKSFRKKPYTNDYLMTKKDKSCSTLMRIPRNLFFEKSFYD